MRIAVVFFGMARGLERTLPAIQENILNPLSASGANITTIASLNMVDVIWSPRSNELGVPMDRAVNLRIPADIYLLWQQNITEIEAFLSAAQMRKDMFDDGWASVRNLLFQLHSLKRAWNYLQSNEVDFDYYMFIRPDLRYIDKLRFREVVDNFFEDGSIALPRWQSYGGFNDRFALADKRAATAYATRIDQISNYCRKKALHPERLLAFSLYKSVCSVADIGIRAIRIRSNEEERYENFEKSLSTLTEVPVKFKFDGNLGVLI